MSFCLTPSCSRKDFNAFLVYSPPPSLLCLGSLFPVSLSKTLTSFSYKELRFFLNAIDKSISTIRLSLNKRGSLSEATLRGPHTSVWENRPGFLAFCHSWLTGKDCLWFLPCAHPEFWSENFNLVTKPFLLHFSDHVKMDMSKMKNRKQVYCKSKKRTQNNQQCTHSNVYLTTVYSSRREKHC